jgi:3-hydroxyisobutyrate dehydrogenase
VLEAIGSRTVWVGDQVGAASRPKLVVNAWLASLNAAVAQSVSMARAPDLDLMREATQGRDHDATLPEVLRAVCGRAAGQGHGGDDMAAVVEAFRPGSA